MFYLILFHDNTIDVVYVHKHYLAVSLHFTSAVCLHSNCEFQLIFYNKILKSAVCLHFNCYYTICWNLNCDIRLFIYFKYWISAVCLYLLHFLCYLEAILKLKLIFSYRYILYQLRCQIGQKAKKNYRARKQPEIPRKSQMWAFKR